MSHFIQYLNQNSVDNVIHDRSKYLFILESPHTVELNNNCPISGPAGIEMSKRINGENEALGLKVKNNKELPISIINVCNAPLQQTQSLKQIKYNFDLLKKVRSGYYHILSHRCEDINNIERIIIDNFRNTISTFKFQYNMTIFVCGNFAKAYWNYLFNKKTNKYQTIMLPHPARNNWNNLNKYHLEVLKEVGDCLL